MLVAVHVGLFISDYCCWWCSCSADESDSEDSADGNIGSWSEDDVHFVTDELAQRIKAASTAADTAVADDNASQESLADDVHPPLSQTVQLVFVVAKSE